MQITPIPQTLLTNLTPTPQALSQALPQVQALAAAPLTKRAVLPTSEKEKMREEHTTKEKFDSGEEEVGTALPDDVRGHFINTSV